MPEISGDVSVGRCLYGDGQVSSPLPVGTARQLGPRLSSPYVMYPPQHAFLYNAVSVLFQSFAVSAHRLKEFEEAGTDLVIAPTLQKTSGQFTFAD